MGELKGLSQDILKSDADIANYNSEFQGLQSQLYQISQRSYENINLFDANGTLPFSSTGITIDINTTGQPHGLEVVELYQLPLLTGLTLSDDASGNVLTTSGLWSDVNTGGDGEVVVSGIYSLAVNTGLNLNLKAVSVETFTQAIENIASLRAKNGANHSFISHLQSIPAPPAVDGNSTANALSFLSYQDSILHKAGQITDRMSELKGLVANDPMKSAADVANYNVEFQDLQTLLFILSGYEFNGHRLFDLNGTQSFASGGITIDVNTTGAHHGVETVQITQLPYLAGLTFSVNASVNTNHIRFMVGCEYRRRWRKRCSGNLFHRG